MRRSSLILFVVVLCFWLSFHTFLNAQTLKVELSPDKSKVDRSVTNGIATIFFDSNVDDLRIVCSDHNIDEEIKKISNKLWFVHINPQKDYELESPCYRNFLLKCPSSSEFYLTTPEIGYNQVFYYTVVLSDQFPATLSAEYVVSKTAKHGIRISFGKHIGGYVCYKWGEYKKQGTDISTITQDYDVTRANELGYIRTAITGGFRLGVMHKDVASLYALIGGGYGEYGRQWENPLEVNNNTSFYSDYIKGFEGEIACQCVLYDWLSISLGTNMVVGNGNISVDYQVGVGLNLNFDKIF